jgi:H/ACA ribonucleoprotein complex subunit 2
MGKERVDKKEKKEKKEKRSDKDGVKKPKKEKKSKLNGDAVAKAIEEQLMETAAPAAEETLEVIEEDVEFAVKPVGALVPFAAPLADDKVAKKVLKSVKKGMHHSTHVPPPLRGDASEKWPNFSPAAKNKTLKRGVKEVVKSLRKSPAGAANITGCGVVILAADISPMDVISHIPVLCEDHNVPYIFVNSRAELGAAGNTKRPTSVVMVSEKRTGGEKEEKIEGEDEFADVYKDLVKLVEKEARSVRV